MDREAIAGLPVHSCVYREASGRGPATCARLLNAGGAGGTRLSPSIWVPSSDPVPCEPLPLFAKNTPWLANTFGLDVKQIRVRFLMSPSPTHPSPTQNSHRVCTIGMGRPGPFWGRSPSLSWGAGGWQPRTPRCEQRWGWEGSLEVSYVYKTTVCQSDLLRLHYFLVIRTTPPSHSCFYKYRFFPESPLSKARRS